MTRFCVIFFSLLLCLSCKDDSIIIPAEVSIRECYDINELKKQLFLTNEVILENIQDSVGYDLEDEYPFFNTITPYFNGYDSVTGLLDSSALIGIVYDTIRFWNSIKQADTIFSESLIWKLGKQWDQDVFELYAIKGDVKEIETVKFDSVLVFPYRFINRFRRLISLNSVQEYRLEIWPSKLISSLIENGSHVLIIETDLNTYYYSIADRPENQAISISIWSEIDDYDHIIRGLEPEKIIMK